MKQTFLPEHFPQMKQDVDLNSLKRKVKDSEVVSKTLKNEEVAITKSKFCIPPSRVNDLSFQTLSILNNLNISSQIKGLKSSDEVLGSVSAREKYQDLLDPLRKLPLPYKYKRLLKIQEYVDNMLNSAKSKKITPAFTSIKQAIENTYSTGFELEQLQKILFLRPDFYRLNWLVENSEEKLIIDFPDDSNYCLSTIHNRNMLLCNELYKLTKHHHSQHLEKMSEKVIFDPDAHKTWHSTFDLHEVPDVSLSELPPKDNSESPTVAKVSVGKQLRAARLTSLCKLLVDIFSCHKTPSIFMKSLTKKIQSEKGSDESIKLIESDVIEICEMFSTWISVIKTGSGDVVRLNKLCEFSLKTAGLKIKQKYS